MNGDKTLISASITLILLFSLSFFSNMLAQDGSYPIDEETGQIMYRDVVEEVGNKEEFFNRGISWINSYYKNPVDVTKIRDPESGLIKGLHRIKLKNTLEDGTQTEAGKVQYRFTLEFKEGRYRYTLTEFALKQSSKIPAEKWLNKSDEQSRSYLQQIDDFVKEWVESLKKGMKPKVEKTDEW